VPAWSGRRNMHWARKKERQLGFHEASRREGSRIREVAATMEQHSGVTPDRRPNPGRKTRNRRDPTNWHGQAIADLAPCERNSKGLPQVSRVEEFTRKHLALRVSSMNCETKTIVRKLRTDGIASAAAPRALPLAWTDCSWRVEIRRGRRLVRPYQPSLWVQEPCQATESPSLEEAQLLTP
jgi:hypothetical protein